MSKKSKGHHKRHKKAKKVNYNAVDRHHLCWTKREWRSGYLLDLRLHPYCVVLIPRDTLHHKLHTKMKHVPPPKPRSVKNALYHLDLLYQAGAINYDDPIEKRLKLLAALFDCTDQPTADAFRKQLKIICEYKENPLV